MSITATLNQWPTRSDGALRWWLLVALLPAADFLLFDQPDGIALFIFTVLLAVAIVVAQGRRSLRTSSAIVLPAAALLPLVENVSLLSLTVAATGLAIAALMAAGRRAPGVAATARQVIGFAVLAPFRLLGDLLRSRKIRRRLGGRNWLTGALGWMLALVLGAVFVALFGAANPLIEDWLARIDIIALLQQLDMMRLIFWLVVACGVWAFLRPRTPLLFRRKLFRRSPARAALTAVRQTSVAQALFGRPALLRALAVFNLIFAVQTVMDAAYLWGGVALPDGMSYATYAHRGAYPLIVTALLAAGFVLAAMRPGSRTSDDRTIRTLVYVWTAQNVCLVLSSILRLDLYVGVYSLTYWRIAAFLWMGLVAAGLLLIIARIALGKTNEWLLSANLLTLSALIYTCCFVNFAALIANYNVDHSVEMNGQGLPIDQTYLSELGPAALPAIDKLLAKGSPDRFCAVYGDGPPLCLTDTRADSEREFRETARNWRSWSFRNWRLMHYLNASTADIPPTGSPAN